MKNLTNTQLSQYVQSITRPALDILCDKSLTLGQTLLILVEAKKAIDDMIKDEQEAVNQQSPKPVA